MNYFALKEELEVALVACFLLEEYLAMLGLVFVDDNHVEEEQEVLLVVVEAEQVYDVLYLHSKNLN